MKKTLHIFTLLITFLPIWSGCETKSLLTEEEQAYLQNSEAISVALYPYFPPYQYAGKRGGTQGIFCDYLELIERKIDYRFQRKEYLSWPQVLEDAKNKKLDIILEAQATPERSEYLKFYDNFFESDFVIVTRKNNTDINTVNSLKGKTVIISKGFSVEELLKSVAPDFKMKLGENDIQSLIQLSNGEGDAFVGPNAVANYIIQSQNITNLEIKSKIGKSYKPSIAVASDNRLLNSIILKATSSISNEEREKLKYNWLYTQIKPFYLRSKFWIIFIPVLLAITVVLMSLNGYLKKKIDKRTLQLEEKKRLAEKDTQFKMHFIDNSNEQLAIPLRKIKQYTDQLSKVTNDEKTIKKLATDIIEEGNQIITNLSNILEKGVRRNEGLKEIQISTTGGKAQTGETISSGIANPYTILIAEDGDINYLLLSTLLNKIDDLSLNIHRAVNGKEAVKYAEENSNIDLVFMDLKMPIMDGYEATQKIKQINPLVPIIVQTAFTSQQAMDLAYEAGCDDYILKPIKLAVLRVKTSQFLHSKQPKQNSN